MDCMSAEDERTMLSLMVSSLNGDSDMSIKIIIFKTHEKVYFGFPILVKMRCGKDLG